MKKIPTIFERDWDGDRSRVLDRPTPGCEWVFEGFGVPTRKFDGTCVMFDGTRWWARREVREGKDTPENFVPLSTDEETGKTIGWEPIGQSPFAKFAAEAIERLESDNSILRQETLVGTYELIGPKVQGNPEKVDRHQLVFHASATEVVLAGRSFDAIKAVLETAGVEGIVFHNADGRMAKIKARDFGVKR